MKKIGLFIIILTLATLIVAESTKISKKSFEIEQCVVNKITFELNSIDKNGLIGSSDGKGTVDYEFCIPYKDRYLKEIHAVDSDIKCHHGPGGRTGCNNNEYLCIGNTGYKNYKNILCKLSALNYIKRIDRTWWE